MWALPPASYFQMSLAEKQESYKTPMAVSQLRNQLNLHFTKFLAVENAHQPHFQARFQHTCGVLTHTEGSSQQLLSEQQLI